MSDFIMVCPNCGISVQVKEEWIGMSVQCPNCQTMIHVMRPAATGAPLPHNFSNMASTIECQGNVTCRNITNNTNIKVTETLGCFSVIEHQKDLGGQWNPSYSFFMDKMNFHPRQVFIKLKGNEVKLQAGAMQWLSGNIECETGLGTGMSAVGNFIKGKIKGLVTKESAVKPLYRGTGELMLEPTYKYILLEDVASWGPQGITIEDGMFLACDASLTEQVINRKNLSSLVAGEGIFNLSFSGNGVLALESWIPREQLYEFNLQDGTLKIDGNMSIAWSSSLQLTMERSSKTLLGSMVNAEGLVQVYRGTGKVLMAPVCEGAFMDDDSTMNQVANDGHDSGSIMGTASSIAEGISNIFND